MSECDIISSVDSEILKKAAEAESLLIPKKSEISYTKEYDKFLQWLRAKNSTRVTETVMLAYFLDQSKIYKSSSLWCTFSKLKCMLRVKENIDIANFSKLIAFIKNCSVGYAPGKSEVFSKEQLIQFIVNAPDDKYLLMKVVAIFGLFGACRRVEFYNLRTDDVKEEGSVLVVHIKDTKTHRDRTFTILNDGVAVDYINIIKNYMNLRPKDVKASNFFIYYNSGRCTRNPIGINTFGQIPRLIATYLEIPNAAMFTGHSFRRTFATILADSGADIRTLKRHGDWRSDAVAEGYVAQSRANKNKIARTLGSTKEQINISSTTDSVLSTNSSNMSGITINGNTNCTIYVNINRN